MKMMQGAFCLGLREQVADPRRADAHEHLDEVGPAQAEEGNARLPRHRLRQQGLAGPRGPDNQNALGDLSAQPTVPLGVFRNSTISISSAFASSIPATSVKVTPVSFSM